jgi:hypothetical protein
MDARFGGLEGVWVWRCGGLEGMRARKQEGLEVRSR